METALKVFPNLPWVALLISIIGAVLPLIYLYYVTRGYEEDDDL